ncbi:MAG: hypothetical protein KC776_36080 [Myxococcales bacterium]|nr:hypothetical protein [Myxococcales bacterium]MCB9577883.1 hypothetical protein [Polyangiaceae bacterium]
MRVSSLLVALVLSFAPLACSQPKVEPVVASSSGEVGYAATYPDALASTRGRLSSQETQARQLFAAFSTYPAELDKTDWKKVGEVYAAADSAGKSADYVKQVRENQIVEDFFDDEKDEISKKVAGAASYAAKQKGCQSTDGVYGSASHALEKSVEKQLEDRLREHSEAHRIIEDNGEALGKANKDKLEKQADDLTFASYLANVGVVQTKVDLKRLYDEGQNVKSTLERSIEEAKAVEADAGRSDADKKAATKRREAAEAAKGRIDSELSQAEHVLKETDDRTAALKAEYDKAYEELKNAVEQKASATPAS